jgi:hypothetical protein
VKSAETSSATASAWKMLAESKRHVARQWLGLFFLCLGTAHADGYDCNSLFCELVYALHFGCCDLCPSAGAPSIGALFRRYLYQFTIPLVLFPDTCIGLASFPMLFVCMPDNKTVRQRPLLRG